MHLRGSSSALVFWSGLASRKDRVWLEEKQVLHITPGERAALRLLAEGKSRRELAASLEVSEPEVEARLMALFRRMGVKTEREAAAECVKRGLLSDEMGVLHQLPH